jgi:hypothetical protein
MTSKSILKLGVLSLLAFAIAGSPTPLLAQSTNKAPAKKTATATKDTSKSDKKAAPVPFNGKLAKLDKINKTITVGKRTFQITSETKINKDSKPATFEDGVEGEVVRGSIKQTDDGKWVALTVNFGPKTAASASKTATPKSADKKAPTPKQ